MKHPEEFEASRLAKDAMQVQKEPSFDQKDLLETFFTGVAQQIAAADGEFTSRKE